MEPNKIWDVFFSLENPVIYGIIFTLIILALVLLIVRKFIYPLSIKKRKLELENAKLAALYSEVDPDPIIRVDKYWKVIDMNNAAKEIFEPINSLIQEFITDVKNNKEKKEGSFVIKILDEYYSAIVKNVIKLKFKHIYLHDISNRIKVEEKINNYKDNLRELRIRMDTINEEQKEQIAKELHDGLGHSLSLLKMDLQNFIENQRYDINSDIIKNIFLSIDNLSEEVREISQEITPIILKEFGLIQAIKSEISRINLQSKMQGYISQNKKIRIAEKKLEKEIYRVCQEALTNIIKHSDCSEFHFDFKLEKSLLSIIISDNGRGFNLTKYNNNRITLGIFTMQERTESAGGSFYVDSLISMGTTISLKFNIIEDKND